MVKSNLYYEIKYISQFDEFLHNIALNNVEFVTKMLKKKKFDPSQFNFDALRMAIDYDNPKIVELLLRDKRMKVEIGSEAIIKIAIAYNSLESLRVILDCDLINVSNIHIYVGNASEEALEIIRKHPRLMVFKPIKIDNLPL